MKTFVAILALSAVLLVGVHTAFADEARLPENNGRDGAPAALYLPGAGETQVISEPVEVRDAL